MNKKRVNDWILPAKEAIINSSITEEKDGQKTVYKIAKDGKVDSAFRSQISSFGAAVVMGSLKSAVAFFADKGQASVRRDLLLLAIYYVISGEKTEKTPREVFTYICENDNSQMKELVIDAAIAIKLALNFFEQPEKKKTVDENGEG